LGTTPAIDEYDTRAADERQQGHYACKQGKIIIL
jgi:hypothetical protein